MDTPRRKRAHDRPPLHPLDANVYVDPRHPPNPDSPSTPSCSTASLPTRVAAVKSALGTVSGRRKKGKRRLFDQRKQKSKRSLPIEPGEKFDDLCENVKQVAMDAKWVIVKSDTSLQLCRMKMSPMSQTTVERSVTVNIDMSWCVHAAGNLVCTERCELLRTLPSHVRAVQTIEEILKAVDSATLCPGSPDVEFVEMVQERGKAFAYVDTTSEVVNTDGTVCGRTVRHAECELLCEPKGSYPKRCKVCCEFRVQLRVMKSRKRKREPEKVTSHDSHTNIRFLTKAEKEERIRNLQKEKTLLMVKNKRLEKKMRRAIKRDGVQLSNEESKEVSSLLEEVDTQVKDDFPPNSFQAILWEEQKRFSKMTNKRQMRWHPLVIRFALSLKYASAAAYRQVTKLGFLALPSERTLRDYTHWCSLSTGVQQAYIEQIKGVMKEEGIEGDDKQFCLLMDEMKVKAGLVFSKSSGKLVGFTDLGTVGTEVEHLAALISGDQTTPSPCLASHMLAFMVRPVFRPSFSFLVAMYPSTCISAEKLFPVVWEVIGALEMNLLPVISVTSDGASLNRRFYKLCTGRGVTHKTRNPYAPERYIYFFSDVPHLLKTARNCFSNSFAHSKSRKLQKGGQEISWKYIENLYLSEMETTTPGVRLCPKLTREHVWLTPYGRMKVFFAAQVLSETVAAALQMVRPDDTGETRVFIRMMDRFFDCLNVKSPLEGVLKRKDYRLPYRSEKDYRFKWLLEDFLGYFQEWQQEIGTLRLFNKKEGKKLCLSRQTLEGLNITVKSFCELGPHLIKTTGRYLLSEVFSQDPVERYFSRQRNRGGGNDNPTVEQFQKNAAILLQKQQLHWDLKTGNVQPEEHSLQQAASLPLAKRPRKK